MVFQTHELCGYLQELKRSVYLYYYYFIMRARAIYIYVSLVFLLAAGASLLGNMPDASELASLRLPLTPGGEDPLTAVTGSASSATGGDPCKVVSAGVTCSIPATDRSGGSSNSASTGQSAGFSLGHRFPLIPQKLVSKILKWKYVSMAELLPNKLELAHRSGEPQRAELCYSKAPKKRE